MVNVRALSKTSLFSWMKMLVFVMLTFAALYNLPLKAEATSSPRGLTIITHGYAITDLTWVSDMANAINFRMGDNVGTHTIRILDSGFHEAILDPNNPHINLTSGAAIIVVDWTDANGGNPNNCDFIVPTSVIGDRIFDYLDAHPSLLQLPIHFIGHSRGGSVMSHLSKRLGEIRVWVDQLTTLDPHPFSKCGDTGLDVPSNVLFADNYYQISDYTGYLFGYPVNGAYNLDLTGRVDGDGHQCDGGLVGNITAHEQIHTYYHGTIGGACADDVLVEWQWYSKPFPDQTRTGFYWTPTGGGDRWATTSEENRKSAPYVGLHYQLQGSGKGSENRESVSYLYHNWSNATLKPLANYNVQVGESVDFTYYYLNAGGNRGTIEFFLDNDTNPLNGNYRHIGTPSPPESPRFIGTANFDLWKPTSTDATTNGGVLYVQIRATNPSGNVRYDYLPKPIAVQAAPTPVPTITSVSPATLPTSSSPQPITIYGSNFLPSGDPNASKLVFYDPAKNPYPSTPTYISSGELRSNITVQSATGTWKVKVVNGGVESSLYTFTVTSGTVQLTGLSISGPATVAENNSGQFTATAIFSNGTSQSVMPSWSENSTVTSISSGGLLTVGGVDNDTTVTVSASYTAGSVTRTASANVTVVNTGGGGTQTPELIDNGGFESGKISWRANTLQGGASGSADILQGTYPRSGTWYAYVGDRLATSSNALGSVHQFIHIPANATSIMLNFYLNVVTAETTVGHLYDKMEVNLRTASDVLIAKLRTFSEADKGANTSGSYSLVTIDMTTYLAAYKDQDVILQFYGDTDSAKYTIFRIDDISVKAVVPLPVTLSSLAINGPSSVTEGNTAQYSATAVFSDGSMQPVIPNTWNENSSATTISSSGLLMAGQVGADTAVTLYASYTHSGVTREAYKGVTVINQAATFSDLAISGPSSVNENSSGQFTATAISSDGTSQSVTPIWSENSTATSISSGGLLTVGDVNSDTTVTVSASYTTGGVTHNASQDVLIINAPTPPPALQSLAINGASSVNENSTAQYTATASFSDGSLQPVNPTWSVDLAATTISIFGLFSAGEVTSDTSVTVSASYTSGGITRNAQKSVTVINTDINPDDVTATINSISPNPATQGTTVNFDGTGTDSLGHSITAYSWRSSIDGIIGTSASFDKNDLSPGSHSIYFKVQCSDGTWSSEIPWSGNPLKINSNCTHTISSTSQSFSSNGGSDKVDVTASSSSCGWTATSTADWITITSGSSGTGNGTVSYLVSANTGTGSRTGTMSIEGQTL